MKAKPILLAAAAVLLSCVSAFAQTDFSLFRRSDGVQVPEIVSETPVLYNQVGHHGPAVENSHFAVRVYFNDSGALDPYCKSGKQMELRKYLWNTTPKQHAEEGAGCDDYVVGSTVGAGGIALWDGEKEIKLVATKGRTARAGKTAKGAYAEIISYGVEYMGEMLDISLRVDMFDNSRVAEVTATVLNGRKVRFLTGINFQPGESMEFGRRYIAVWGTHPTSPLTQDPLPVGAGLKFKPLRFSKVEKTADMLRIISKPARQVKTKLIVASVREDELNTPEKFFSYMAKR